MDPRNKGVEAPPWAEDGLFELLDGLRRDGGFSIGVREHLAAREAAAAWRAASSRPNGQRLCNWLAPVVCTTVEQQEEFYRRFADWSADRDLEQEPPRPSPAAESETRERENKARSRSWWLAACGALILVAGLSAGIRYQRFQEQAANPPAFQPAPGQPAAPATGSLRARVADTDKQPLPSVKLTLTGSLSSQVTDEQGRAEFRDLPVGRHELRAESPGFLSNETSAQVEAGTVIEVFLALRRGLTVTGRVVDSAGNPLPNAVAQLDSGDESDPTTWPILGISDRSGRFEFQVDPEDSSQVVVFDHPEYYLAARFDHAAIVAEGHNLRVVLGRWFLVSLLLEYRSELRAILIFLLLATGPWLTWLRRRKLMLERRSTHALHGWEAVGLPEPRHRLYRGSAFSRVRVEALRRLPTGPRYFDPAATIEAAVRRQGFSTPIYRQGSQLPIYLALVDRSGFRDQRASMVDELLDRLQAGDVEIERYDFDRNPRLCALRHGESAHRGIRELAGLHPEYRLLLFGDGGGLVDSVTGQIKDWLELFSAWPHRALLTPVPVDHWSRRELALEGAGFRVLPATAGGVQCFVESLRTADSSRGLLRGDRSPAFPSLISRRPARWLERHPPEAGELDELCSELRHYLGSDGFRWLSSLAICPQLTWHLTLHLGLRLRRPDGSAVLDETDLLALTRLPWLRHGSMPDWLRLRLIRELSRPDETALRNFLQDLLEQHFEIPSSRSRLEVARPRASVDAKDLRIRFGRWLEERRLWSRLKDEVSTEPTFSDLRDQIFVGFFLGKKQESLRLPAPGNWQRLAYQGGIPAFGLRPALILSAAMVIALVGGSLFGDRIEADSLASEALADLGRFKTDPVINSEVKALDQIVERAEEATQIARTGQTLGVYALARMWQQKWHYSAWQVPWSATEFAKGERITDEALAGRDTAAALLARGVLAAGVCRKMPSAQATERDDWCERAIRRLDQASAKVGDDRDLQWMAVEIEWNAIMAESALAGHHDDSDPSRARRIYESALARCRAVWPKLSASPVNDREVVEDCLTVAGPLQAYRLYLEWSKWLVQEDRSSYNRVTRQTRQHIVRAVDSECVDIKFNSKGVPLFDSSARGDVTDLCRYLGLVALGCDALAQRFRLNRQSGVPWAAAERAASSPALQSCVID